MKNTIAGGVVALSLMASGTSIANESDFLDLENLEILTSGQVQLDGDKIKPSIIPADALIVADVNGICPNNGCIEV